MICVLNIVSLSGLSIIDCPFVLTSVKINLEDTEGAITNGQSRDTGNIEHTIRRNTRQSTTQCVGHHYGQINTIDVNKA